MNKLLSAIFIVALTSAGCQSTNSEEVRKNPNTSSLSILEPDFITVKDQVVTVELANTPALRELGLSGRDQLPESAGMLFDFTNTTEKRPSFWMKDMKFDLDIIWIKNEKIIGIAKNITAPVYPDAKLETYEPPGEIDYALEVQAGWSDKFSITEGDPAKLSSQGKPELNSQQNSQSIDF